MEKYFKKDDPNTELKVGDNVYVLTQTSPSKFALSNCTLTHDFLNQLVDCGIVIKKNIVATPITIDSVVYHLAERLGWRYENLDKYLNNLYKISPLAVFQILLKEYAIMLDNGYKDHISKCIKLWAINAITGEVIPINNCNSKGKITNIALFRTKEAAESARTLFNKAIAELF